MSVRRIVPDLHTDGDPTAGRALFEDVLGLELAMDTGWIVTYVDPADPKRKQLQVMRDDTSGRGACAASSSAIPAQAP